MYLCIPAAAFLPSPMARITVAPPRTISPPANRSGMEDCMVSLSTTIVPHFDIFRSGRALGINGLGDTPTATITKSTSMLNSESLMGMGRLLPEASGSPSFTIML